MAAAVPYIMVAAAVAGTAVSVYSAVKAGDEAKAARDREAQQLARSAEQSRLSAKQKAEDTKKLHEKILARQRALYGASGVEMTGTPLLVQMESMKESEEELKRIIEAGEMGYGTQMEAAGESRIIGGQAATSGYVKAGGAAIEGVGTLSKVYRNYWGTT